MKKTLLSVSILLLISIACYPIVSLTQANTAPAIGDVLSVYSADTMAVEGPAGASQTWTFNNLIISGTPDVTTVVTVASTPFAASYPNANVAESTTSGAYEFLNSSSGALIQMGSASGAQVSTITPGITFFTYPFTFNSVATTSSFTGTHSQGTLSGSNVTTGDAYGSITINGHTIANVIRIKVVQDEDLDYTSIGHLVYHIVSYIWYDGINKTPVLEMVTEDMSGLTTQHIKLVEVGSFVTGVDNISASSLALNIFPNPTRNEANISFSLSEIADVIVKIYDYTGAEVSSENLGHLSPAIIKKSIDVSTLSKGIYMLEVIADDVRNTKRLIVY